MKEVGYTTKALSLSLALFLGVGCSDSTPKNGGSTESASILLKVEVVETKETKEVGRLEAEAKDLFQRERYEELETLAHKHRTSGESFPTGSWYLERFYSGLEIDRKEPDEVWLKHIAKCRAWLRKSPKAITPRVALADTWVSFGWKARGSGYADTVTDGAQKLFYARLAEAAKLIKEAKKLEEQCPELWAVELRVALGQGWDRKRYDAVYKQAISISPQYFYQSARAYHLLPRWYGKPGEWESDLLNSADSLGGKNGDLLYARVVWRMEGPFKNIFKENNLSWARVDRGFAEMEDRFPSSLYVTSMRAYMSVFGGDRETAKKYIDRLEGKVDLSVWKSLKNYNHLKDWANGQ